MHADGARPQRRFSQHHSRTYNQPYWLDEESGVTQWEPPPQAATEHPGAGAVIAPATAAATAAAAATTTSSTDIGSAAAAAVAISPNARRASLDKIAALEMVLSGVQQEAAVQEAEEAASKCAEEWSVHTHAESGHAYYVSAATGVSQWDAPPGWSQPAATT